MSGWVVVLVLLGVVVATVLVALAGGWRPGRGVRRNQQVVQDEVRDRLGLPIHDWWTIRRVVRQGESAPERLRPAAYELADALVRFQDQSSWPPSRRVLIVGVCGVYLALVAVYAVVDAGRAAFYRPLSTVVLAVVLLGVDSRQRANLRRARDANG